MARTDKRDKKGGEREATLEAGRAHILLLLLNLQLFSLLLLLFLPENPHKLIDWVLLLLLACWLLALLPHQAV